MNNGIEHKDEHDCSDWRLPLWMDLREILRVRERIVAHESECDATSDSHAAVAGEKQVDHDEPRQRGAPVLPARYDDAVHSRIARARCLTPVMKHV